MKKLVRRLSAHSTQFGLGVNIAYALYNGVLGIYLNSVWFGATCAYYLILSIARFTAVLATRKLRRERHRFILRSTGVLLSLMSLVLTVILYISLSQNVSTEHGEIIMITIAAYTTYKITMAAIKAVKHRNDNSPIRSTLRGIRCAEVAVSLFTMQKSMLVSFGDMAADTIKLMNLLTGSAVCIFILALGIIMIRNSKGENSKWQNQSS